MSCKEAVHYPFGTLWLVEQPPLLGMVVLLLVVIGAAAAAAAQWPVRDSWSMEERRRSGGSWCLKPLVKQKVRWGGGDGSHQLVWPLRGALVKVLEFDADQTINSKYTGR